MTDSPPAEAGTPNLPPTEAEAADFPQVEAGTFASAQVEAGTPGPPPADDHTPDLPPADGGALGLPPADDETFDFPPVEAGKLAWLHRELEHSAGEAALLDVAYTIVDSPVGALLLAATITGLLRVAFPNEDHDRVLETLAIKVSPRIMRAPARLDDAARQLDEYFAGTRFHFDLVLDRSLSHGFRQMVQGRIAEIEYGHTQSYAQVATLVGNPKAVRAVASACATNPLPVVVPCHRVLRTDGTLGGYRGGPEAKNTLLSLEAAA